MSVKLSKTSKVPRKPLSYSDLLAMGMSRVHQKRSKTMLIEFEDCILWTRDGRVARKVYKNGRTPVLTDGIVLVLSGVLHENLGTPNRSWKFCFTVHKSIPPWIYLK